MAVTTLGSPSFNPIPLGSSSAPTSGQSITVVGGGQMTAMVGETDPIFSAWDKSTGISIYSSQIIADAADIVPTGLTCIEDGLEQAEGSGQSAYVILDWNDISTDTFDYYRVRYKKSTDTYYGEVTSKVSSIRIAGLLPNTTYNFSIASVNKQGTSSAFSTPSVDVATDLDSSAPATVTGVAAYALMQAVKLSWTHNTELDLASYNIYRNTTDTPGSLIANCTTNVYIDANLTGEQIQYYWVKAKDTSGNLSASYSTSVNATPRSVSTTDILDDAITAAKTNIAAINPTNGEINENKVGSLQLNVGAVTEAKIAASAVTAAKLSVAAIDASGNISANAVGSTQIDTGAVTEAKILADAITAAKIATGAVGSDQLAAGAVIAGKITAGTITAADIQAGAITANKLSLYNFMVSEGTFTSNSPSPGEVAWSSCKVVYNGTEKTITDGHCESTDVWIYWEGGNSTFSVSSSLPSLNDDDFLVASNDGGTYTLVWNSTKINGNRITAGTISASHIAAGAITAEKIEAGAITADKIATGSLTSREIVSYNFQVIGRVLTGSINPTASTTVNGVGTLFLTEVSAGDHIIVSGETRKVASVDSNILLYVDTAFSDNDNDTSPDVITENVFQNNVPSPGEVFWPDCKVVYNGVEYTVASDHCESTDVYIYWQPALPTVFGKSATIPLTSNEYFLVGTNGNTYYASGTFVYAWNNTTIDGNRITTGSIYTDLLAANCITTNKLDALAVTAEKIAADAITADKIDVDNLSALSASMGELTSGSIVIGTTNKLWLNEGSDGALNIGGTVKGSAPFRVTSAGVLTAESGTIGGWSIDDSYIWSGAKHTGDGYTTSAGDITLNANDGSIHTNNFYVDADGECSFKAAATSDIGGLGFVTVEVSNWNMNVSVGGSSYKNVAFPGSVDIDSVKLISAVIYNDDHTLLRNLESTKTGAWGYSDGAIDCTASTITLYVRTGGSFDDADYDGTGIVRGYVTIQYTT